jgi:queuine tRNA-ribosyltransferase
MQNFIPVLTSEAGLALTTENWQEIETTTVSCTLEHLLYKPGLDILKKLPDLRHYLAWPGDIVLNAMTLRMSKEGIYTLKSPYDGSKIKLSVSDLVELILHLKPKVVILPENMMQECPQIWDNWSDAIIPFISVNDLLKQQPVQSYGVYFNEFSNLNLNWEQLDQWSHVSRYVMGNFEPQLIHEFQTKKIEFIETNEPANAAMQGKVYNKAGIVDLTNKESQMQFETIDGDCACPTCAQQLTKAYLYHLLQNTPLLCQRFLIQHNVYYVQHY